MSDKTEGAGTGEGKGSLLLPIRLWLWRMAAALRRRPPIAERRLASSSQTQGEDGRSKRAQEKKKRAEGRWGPLLRWSAGDQRPPFRRARADGQHPA